MNISTVKETHKGFFVNGETFVPNDPANIDYRGIQDWIAEGNTPEPIETPQEEQDRLEKEFRAEQKRRLAATDYTQLMDENELLTTAQQDEIFQYRADVRNATLATGFPTRPVWFVARGM